MRHMKMSERLSEHTKHLPPLAVGEHVRIQNQIGPNPTKWDKTGQVIEVRQFDQYVIRLDGSGRVTLRNRKFLRKFEPVNPGPEKSVIDSDLILQAKQHETKLQLHTKPDITNNDIKATKPVSEFRSWSDVQKSTMMPDLANDKKTDMDNSSEDISIPPPPVTLVPSPAKEKPIDPPIKVQVNQPNDSLVNPNSDVMTRRSERKKMEPVWLRDYIHTVGAE